jgi:hypothetical protein
LPPEPEEPELDPLVELFDGAGCGAGFGLLLPPPVSAPTMLLTVCPRLMPPMPPLEELVELLVPALLVEVDDGTETVFGVWLVLEVAGRRAVSAAFSLQALVGGAVSPGGTPPPGSGTHALRLDGSVSFTPG